MSFRIIDFNFAFDPSTLLSASSEDSEFPSANMAKHFRSKVWRSSGYFVISATNKFLDFDEGGGELNATLQEGTYTIAELESEIKAQLDSTGGDTYTVSYSTGTGLWTISSDGGTLSLLWSTGTNTANSVGSTIGHDTSSDSTGATSYVGATIAIHTEEWLQFDLGTWGSNPIDSLVVLFDKLDGSNLSNSAVVKLQAHQTQDFSAPSVDETLTFTRGVFSHFFTTAQNYRYWRINIVDPHNPDRFVEIPKVVLGRNNQVIVQAPEMGYTETIEDRSTQQDAVYGNEYFDILPNVDFVSYAWSHLEDTEKAELRDIFNRVGISTPITIVIDDQEAVFANVEEHIHYGRIVGGIQFEQSFRKFFNTAIQLVEAL